jgi:hypothetical protein
LNRPIAELNATRPRDKGLAPIDKKVARVEYIPEQDTVRCLDQPGQAFLALTRQPDGPFAGTLEVEFHELVSSERHGWGHIIATFTLPGERFRKPEAP